MEVGYELLEPTSDLISNMRKCYRYTRIKHVVTVEASHVVLLLRVNRV